MNWNQWNRLQNECESLYTKNQDQWLKNSRRKLKFTKYRQVSKVLSRWIGRHLEYHQMKFERLLAFMVGPSVISYQCLLITLSLMRFTAGMATLEQLRIKFHIATGCLQGIWRSRGQVQEKWKAKEKKTLAVILYSQANWKFETFQVNQILINSNF
jgi:hypothetical protein